MICERSELVHLGDDIQNQASHQSLQSQSHKRTCAYHSSGVICSFTERLFAKYIVLYTKDMKDNRADILFSRMSSLMEK